MRVIKDNKIIDDNWQRLDDDLVEDELPDGEHLGTNLGFEHIFCWLREIWDCRDGSMILYHTDLPREEAERKFLEDLKHEAENWLEAKA